MHGKTKLEIADVSYAGRAAREPAHQPARDEAAPHLDSFYAWTWRMALGTQTWMLDAGQRLHILSKCEALGQK